jgi:DNA adenine methylase
MATKSAAQPFIKWAGGKRQLLPALSEILPRRMKTYYEPFLGGGAVFFHLAAEGRFERAVLNDWNRELIDCYRVIRDFPDDLIRKLLDHMSNEWNTASYFDTIRAQKPEGLDPAERAARMIYLNKTCFNGLYRVNKRNGQFNVPFGRYKNPTLFNEQNLRACSQVLNRLAALHTGDFVNAVETAGEGDVVYFDPPYVPLSVTSNFASYTSDGFSINDHHRLAALFRELFEKGVAIVLSNSDTEIVRALYQGFEMHPVQAKRHINSKADGRGPVGELIIVGRRPAIYQDEPPPPPEPIPVPDETHCSHCGEIYAVELPACPQCGTSLSVEAQPEGDEDAEVHSVP